MKKLFTLALLLSGMLTASAMPYIPFPTANAIWTIRHGNSDMPPDYSIIGLKTGDTVISGKTYHKVYRSKDIVLDESEYCGGLREDAFKHVYYYDAANRVERMIYDFSVAIGDTIRELGNTPTGIVHSIDSVKIAGTWHRRINFRQLNATTVWTGGSWVEGMGNSSLGGLISSPVLQPTCDCGINTVCFRSGSTWTYHNPAYATLDCEAILSTPTISYNTPLVTLYPNPVRSVSHLLLSTQAGYTQLTITNLLGRQIVTADVTGKNDFLIDNTRYTPGVYIYHLTNADGGSFSGKFLVE